MEKRFLSDVDGCVLHWGPGLEKYVKSLPNDFDFNEDIDIESFFFVEDWLGITREEACTIIEEFHDSEYFKYLPPYLDAPNVIPRFKDVGWSFIAVTAVAGGENTKEYRRQNLETYFPGVFEDIVLTDPKESKLEQLSKFDSTFWIDDTRNHAISGAEAGHVSFHMKRDDDVRPYLEHPDVIDVESWEEVYNWMEENKQL